MRGPEGQMWGELGVASVGGSEALTAHTFKPCPNQAGISSAFQPLPLHHSTLPSPWVITDCENIRFRGSRPGFYSLLHSHGLARWSLSGPQFLCLWNGHKSSGIPLDPEEIWPLISPINMGKNLGFRARNSWLQILAQPFISFMALGKSLSEPQFTFS